VLEQVKTEGMCICLAASLLTHVGTVPSNKWHGGSHHFFRGRSASLGELQLGTLLWLAPAAGWGLVAGMTISPLHQAVGAFSENHRCPCLVCPSSLAA